MIDESLLAVAKDIFRRKIQGISGEKFKEIAHSLRNIVPRIVFFNSAYDLSI